MIDILLLFIGISLIVPLVCFAYKNEIYSYKNTISNLNKELEAKNKSRLEYVEQAINVNNTEEFYSNPYVYYMSFSHKEGFGSLILSASAPIMFDKDMVTIKEMIQEKLNENIIILFIHHLSGHESTYKPSKNNLNKPKLKIVFDKDKC